MHSFKYLNKKISQDFVIFKQFYFFGKPLFKNLELKKAINSLNGANISYIEKKRFIGYGFKGISAEAENIKGEKFHIEGEYNMVEFVGTYEQLDVFLRKLKRENPLGRYWYNMYLNKPVEENDKIIAWVLFKNIA